ncbi:MAG: CAP domain-containing protein [Sphingobacteriales bacterium]|nr:MAG: CAP domain-containing protein [Sphingobacteriales bacterium]
MQALFIGIIGLFNFFSPAPATQTTYVSPLAGFSAEWNNQVYAECNTAETANYMTADEKELIHILNLARKNPTLFASTVVAKFPSFSGDNSLGGNSYFKSLMATLQQTNPLPILRPNEVLFKSAFCHAETSGKSGYVGHDRQTAACEKSEKYFGECCDYGHNKPLDIIMALLIDKDVPSLGHRKICLGSYATIGVSIQPHKTYRFTSVLDLGY